MNLSLLTLPFLAVATAFAQCPAGVDASTLLQGGPWAIQLQSGDLNPQGSAAIGTFTARPGGIITGILTTSNRGALNRRIDASGRSGRCEVSSKHPRSDRRHGSGARRV